MLAWFEKNAPIRTKFKVLLGAQTILASAMLATTYLAGVGPSGSEEMYTVIAAVLAVLAAALIAVSGRIICRPYVNSVVRMEALAAGDLVTPIVHTDHADCVGRMARAMQVFRDNAQKVHDASVAQDVVVAALGDGLTRLASSDLSHRIDQAFPADYERLRLDYNRALDAVAETMSAVTEAT
ncbi:MAG: methyl-accepting chemotaxis protein, partial [Sphingomonas sp.]